MRFALLLVILLLSTPSFAGLKCDVDLQYGVLVSKNRIRVIDESRTLYQINGNDQLIVKGEWIQLNPQQTEVVAELSKGIHYAVPRMILLATEGVQLAVNTVEHVYLGLVGSEHKSYKKLQRRMERVQVKVRKKFIHSGDNYLIGPGSLENVDDFVDKELEEQIEQAINTSLGGILSAIGGLTSNGDDDLEQRMEDLSQRLETVGEEIERHVSPQADTLRKKARWFCTKMKTLNQLEEQLRQEIPTMRPYNVIVTGDSDLNGADS